jgi:NAD+ synthase (glutamine-hydrolysing)
MNLFLLFYLFIFKMHPELQKHLQNYRTSCGFNVEEWTQNKATLLNNYMTLHKLSACVVGCSGGIDSSVTFGLCKFAQNMEGSPIKHIVPVLMPMNLHKKSYHRAIELCDLFKVTPVINPIELTATRINQDLGGNMMNWLNKEEPKEGGHSNSVGEFAYGQLQSYLRTPHLYFTAQIMSERGFPAIVMGTGNKDEDGYLAYFCKAGDGVVDVQLINDLHKSQVYQVGQYLKLPASILEAKPTADLWDGQTDEDEMGVSYDFVELFTGYFLNLDESQVVSFRESLSSEALLEFTSNGKLCSDIHNRNKHKLNGIVNL